MHATRKRHAAAVALLVALTVTGCSAGGSGGGGTDAGGGGYGAQPSEAPSSSSSSAPADETRLMTADSTLGTIVVDAEGRTLYIFDNDVQGSGASSCTGDCLTKWPPLTSDGDAPEVTGVTGEVGTITTDAGTTQVTLNGWPLYYFAGDAAAGDVNGQGVGGIWWVLSPAGERMTG